MGKAVIVENKQEGLYSIRLVWDTTRQDRELAELKAKEAAYIDTILQATTSYLLLERDAQDAVAQVETILEQWSDGLIAPGAEAPPELPPDPPLDPLTGLPWEDPDRAQDGPLFDAINLARTDAGKSALTRNALLDNAALGHLRWLRDNDASSHIGIQGSTPEDRASWAGFPWVTVDELLAYGSVMAGDAVADWLRFTEMKPVLLDATADTVGVAYLYAPAHIGSHLWCAVVAQEGAEVPIVTGDPPSDPAKEAAADLEKNRIEPPHSPMDVPDKLQKAAAVAATAIGKAKAAKAEMARLKAERIERTARIAALEADKASISAIEVDAFCVNYSTELAIGSTVDTMEMPGYLTDDATYRHSETLNTLYVERDINIAPTGIAPASAGKLVSPISTSPAAVYWNAAMEPGHLKWKPLWRYGTLTRVDVDRNRCDVTLTAETSRLFHGERTALGLNASATLTDVPISYPPCHAAAFFAPIIVVGGQEYAGTDPASEVLVLFEGQDRDKPKVIGFRRDPRSCAGRLNWHQL